MRNQRQKEFTEFLINHEHGILNLCCRFGKCKVVIDYLKAKEYNNILIIHPIIPIKKSWQDDFIKWGFDASKVKFATTASLTKIHEMKFDVIISDEIHQFSQKQLQYLRFLIRNQDVKRCIGLSGTLSDRSTQIIKEYTGLEVINTYSMEQGINEGIISDYRITIVTTSLDNKVKYITPNKTKPSFKVTEQEQYNYFTRQIDRIKEEGGDLGFLPIMRLNLFKKSIAKQELTKKLVEKYSDERLLIFCGVTTTADSLGVSVFHSKSSEEHIKDDFCNGKIQHLAVCKMLNAGVTVLPINRAIINSFDSNSETTGQQLNRLTNFEYDNPNKVAQVTIVSTNAIAELKWLSKALSFFNPDKIIYKKYEEL